MRVSTRIILGFAVLMVLAAAALVYHVIVIGELQKVNSDLFSINQRALGTVTRLRYDVEAILEFSKKYFLVSRADYERDLHDSWKVFENNLSTLQNAPPSEKEGKDLAQLAESWNEYRRQWEAELEENPQGQTEFFSFDLFQKIDDLR